MQQRLARVREVMAQQGLEGLLVSQPENRRYLSGFTGSAGVLILTQERALLATDFRYYEQVKLQAPNWELVEVPQDLAAVLANQVTALGLKRLGFESDFLTVETYEQWRAALPQVEWVPTSGLVAGLRQVKDAEELALIEEAVRLADEAMVHLMAWIRPGMTERQVAWELEVYLRTHGAEALSFTPIVAFGPNGAMAHAQTSDRALQEGEPIVIDMGAVYRGYCSDLTRSFCLGRATEEYRAVWDLVLQAQLAAEAAIKPGLSGAEADAVARKIIYGAGHEGHFGHGLGHGVGLAIHEKPRASFTSTDTLQAGMVLTVEPGIYLPGWGGVRIEDMVVITPEGCRVLTRAPKVPVI